MSRCYPVIGIYVLKHINFDYLETTQFTWLITGVAGFIGSNLLESLLLLNQRVVGLDNFSTGHRANLDMVEESVGASQWLNFKFLEGDIGDLATCKKCCLGVDYILHQAALGSVPRSISDPIATNQSNINGFLNILVAAKDEGVKRVVYAASSSTYGDHPALPKKEDTIGSPLSPYAVTKYVNELYAGVFAKTYGLSSIGLRYFNVFGKRQDPAGAYAAVIPRWIKAILTNQTVYINGDGSTSRDFCYVKNVVKANVLAALTPNSFESSVFNIGCGDQTSLLQLFSTLKAFINDNGVNYNKALVFRDFREGDVKHSMASIAKAKEGLGYHPAFRVNEGLSETVSWYLENVK